MQTMATPPKMRAAMAASYGDQSVLSVTTTDSPPQPSKDQILIRVHSMSLSPSDYRILTGTCGALKKPPKNKFPYIPGGDLAGVVHAVPLSETGFRPGDRVLATWDLLGFGALAEYVLVDRKLVTPIPAGTTFHEAAAIADSPVNAMLAVEEAEVKHGDRVLILGGSGGVGTAAIQLARRAGASFIAATSTDAELVKSLGADEVLDYRKTKWWEHQSFLNNPFDVIIDAAEGQKAWAHACSSRAVKPARDGGRFLAVVVNDWHIEIRSYLALIPWMARPMWRHLQTRIWRDNPKYTMLFPAPRGDSTERFQTIYAEGGFRVVLDPKSPFPFSTEGVREAFELMIARKAHGKVVIAVV